MSINPHPGTQPDTHLDTSEQREGSSSQPHPHVARSSTAEGVITEEETITDEETVLKEATPELDEDMRRIYTMTEEIMAAEESERDMESILKTLRETNESLDKKMAKFNDSLASLEKKLERHEKRKAEDGDPENAKR